MSPMNQSACANLLVLTNDGRPRQTAGFKNKHASILAYLCCNARTLTQELHFELGTAAICRKYSEKFELHDTCTIGK